MGTFVFLSVEGDQVGDKISYDLFVLGCGLYLVYFAVQNASKNFIYSKIDGKLKIGETFGGHPVQSFIFL